MSFLIDFSMPKIKKKAANTNIHDDLLWEFAYVFSEVVTPINQWPQQYTVHYIYEFMNRPWLSEKVRIDDSIAWLKYYAPDLEIPFY